ncbi:uncharacterized protein LOC135082663 [Ostrinia nubilalis]|uniref:uncharacterized protein LOC135082663 n=1 Tax=Ostrinia nubilalis TaxID=29057 RepID=UPI00308234CD
MCHCNNLGWWTDSDCVSIERRVACIAGQIVWQGCSQCICQENGQLHCSDAGCYNDSPYRGVDAVTSTRKTIDTKDSTSTWCTPFKSYYINCSICVCPASGRTAEAHCATDTSCHRLSPSSTDFLLSVNKNICIPQVMYLFPCLHCLCSDGGYFILEKCVETCHRPLQIESTRRCISRTFYRRNCNVCWCPDDSMPDDKFCTQNVCTENSKFTSLETLRTLRIKCHPYSFLKPKCFYCGCNTNGNINENACLELDCLKTNDFKYDVAKLTCSPGEMVPSCTECFCLRNGMTNKTYCTNVCSYQSKLSLLDKVLKDSFSNQLLIDRKDIKRIAENELCEPNTMYIDQGRYCLCPENGSTNYKLCTSVSEESHVKRPNFHSILKHGLKYVDLKMNCTPNSFVEIDCNTCYCAKNGKIDPKWCTYDDCNAKKIIQDTHKSYRVSTMPSVDTCIPGSISKVGCNYCICPESGILKDRACTKNKCSEIQEQVDDDKFVCEPLAYYLVDCNVCLCPRDGVKNVQKCTKKICEKTFLRSDSCVSGKFFSNGCNVCVCPPNGDKSDKVCTKHRCSDFDTPWKKIFRLSQNLLDNRVTQDNKRELDFCFSGEEFEIGCKICVCPDVGLRSYATCTESLCDKESNKLNVSKTIEDVSLDENIGAEISHIRYRRDDGESCMTFNLTDSSERKECTPGSVYIIRCRQCICPYMGNINYFCRPLPKGTYCEQAYPNFNYLPMGRRTDEKNSTSLNATTTQSPFRPMKHNHTKYSCTSPGKIMDACFICECQDDLVLIEEHCFKSTAEKCRDAEQTFLDNENKAVVTK